MSWGNVKKLQAGLKEQSRLVKAQGGSGKLSFGGAKFKGGFHPAELYKSGLISKAGMHRRILANRTRNLTKNLWVSLRKKSLKRPEIIREKGKLPKLEGDIDVWTDAPHLQLNASGQAQGLSHLGLDAAGAEAYVLFRRQQIARAGNYKAELEIFDTVKPRHGLLDTQVPDYLLPKRLRRKGLTPDDQFGSGGHMLGKHKDRKLQEISSDGEEVRWVGAREKLEYLAK